MFTLGTGVGGGVIIDGKPIDGKGGAAGELGHLHITNNYNFKCNCGLTGCLETIASATGIINIAKILLIQNPDSILDIDNLNGKVIFDAAEKGDRVAVQVVNELANALGLAASIVSVTLNPECFIIGGGLSKSGKFILDLIEKYYHQYAFHACADTKFYIAKLGNDCGMVGAALLTQL